MNNKIIKVILNSIPLLLMIGLIPVVMNDFILTGVYIAIIGISFFIKIERREPLIFISGFLLMIFFEYIFISTGVETFVRNSLLGLMPLWLPFIWGYGFVAIKRLTRIID